MTIKRLMLSLVVVAGLSASANAAETVVTTDQLVGLGTLLALEKSNVDLGLVNPTVVAALTLLAKKYAPADHQYQELLCGVNRAALITWLHSAVKALANHKTLAGYVRSVPFVGQNLADALFGNAELKARIVGLAAAIAPDMHVPYLS